MTTAEYSKAALETVNGDLSLTEQTNNGALGLAGEAGEVCDMIKKALYQEHSLIIARLMEELGDCLWYINLLADTYGMTLEEIMMANIAKLRKRYPAGHFSGEASRLRVDMNTHETTTE